MTRSLLLGVAALFTLACTGPMGPPGPTGITGSQGSTGMAGSQGSTGMTGSQGSTGMTGSQGSTGMTGSQGSAGVTGAQGPAGMAGARSPAYPGTNWAALREFTFDYDRTDIRSSELNQSPEIAAYVRQNPSVRLGIDGSTDLLRGTNQYNAGLSQRRIATVRDALIQAGVSAEQDRHGRVRSAAGQLQ
jgi:outer membrane protein OmpA-like peptidoglycan-associated protein